MGRRRRLHGRNGHHLRPALSATADLIVRYADPNNFYAIRIQYLYQGLGDRTISLLKRVRGKETTLATNTYTQDTTLNLKVEVDGSTIKAWLDDVEKINTNGLSEIPAGGVGLRTAPCSSFVYYVWFDNLKVGYDNNSDGDIDDEGDDLITSNGFGSTALSLTHDNNGNLTDDGMYKYTYDPWNRLVKVTAKEDTDITIQQATYDALGRRIKKVVTNSGGHDGTVVYYYNGHQIIETRDGSSNLMSQVYHGTQYIDEIVSIRLEHGRAYVHQDANWNVTTLTDLKGAVLERYYYSPYGQLEVVAETYFGDYDGDGDIDADDADDLCTTGCTCEFTSSVTGDCRVFDFDCDGDLDETDQNTLRSLYQGLSEDMQNHRIPSTTFSQTGNLFFHQGLVLDAEIGSYQNRARQYNAKFKRFMQRDCVAFKQRRFLPKENYVDGMNLYEYLQGNPVATRDPAGLGTSTVNYTCTLPCNVFWSAHCFGTCSCTIAGASPSLGGAMRLNRNSCCMGSCYCLGCFFPWKQPAAMTACMQIQLRAVFGPGLSCTCT